jgi:hypothetical protein
MHLLTGHPVFHWRHWYSSQHNNIRTQSQKAVLAEVDVFPVRDRSVEISCFSFDFWRFVLCFTLVSGGGGERGWRREGRCLFASGGDKERERYLLVEFRLC